MYGSCQGAVWTPYCHYWTVIFGWMYEVNLLSLLTKYTQKETAKAYTYIKLVDICDNFIFMFS